MKRLALSAIFFFAFYAGASHALQAIEFGDYIVHYSAFNSDMLHPPIAKTYGIQRSHNRGVLTIAIARKPGQVPADVKARVDTRTAAADKNAKPLAMREVQEGKAVYYLADFPVANGETIDFDVSVRPEGAPKTYEFHFRQQFFTKPPR